MENSDILSKELTLDQQKNASFAILLALTKAVSIGKLFKF